MTHRLKWLEVMQPAGIGNQRFENRVGIFQVDDLEFKLKLDDVPLPADAS